jgi:hypothetical protein
LRKFFSIGVLGIIILLVLMSGCLCCLPSSSITNEKDSNSGSTGSAGSNTPVLGSYENPVPSGNTITMTISNGDAVIEYSVEALAKGDSAWDLLNAEYNKQYKYLTFSKPEDYDYIILKETLKVISVKNPPVSGYDFSEYSGHITTSMGADSLAITTIDKYSGGLNSNSLFPGQSMTGYTTLSVPKGTVNEQLVFYRNVGFKNYYFNL